ncbi:hypothetical protein [Streptomyces profundus]|uniref:hypothetical protein n=1 Tax=Streptomyces profundus TaxID=2867410 RepID=UPI001D15EA16|nr:hypothetical protein [Streptomyces sp. MA3_2.13]UED87798.1 hypothetical protein K4G22_29350 [Streptomyces sp. MA3_2.13]
MDQGLAAALGAVVGVLAVVAGSYLTAFHAKKAQKREARRDVYRAFLSELSEAQAQIQKLRDSILYGPRDEIDDDIGTRLKEMENEISRLRNLEVGVRLEGPDSISSSAREVTQVIAWTWARMKFTHTSSLDEDTYYKMVETIEADCFSLEEKVNSLLQEAPRHL